MVERGLYSSLVDAAEREGRLNIRLRDIRKALPSQTASAIKLGMIRLERRGRVLRLQRGTGHWLVVPMQFATLGAPPLEAWLDEYLSNTLKIPYYVGLLSAAETYGVAPYAVMATTTFVTKQRRNLTVGRQRIDFMTRDGVQEAPVEWFETSYGRIRVSSPELTICDLVHRSSLVGGAERVLGTLAGLIRHSDLERLLRTAQTFVPVPVMQRVGALLALAHLAEWASAFQKALVGKSLRIVELEPSAPTPRDRSYVDDKFKVRIPIDISIAGS